MSIAIQFITLMAIFSFIESLWPASRAHKWWRRPLLVDLCAWLIHPLTLGAGIALAAAAVNTLTVTLPPREPWIMITAMRETTNAWPSWVQIAVAFFLADFLSYWIHRAYHHFPALWSFHVVHHTSEELNWLSTSRLHPVSQVVDTAVVAVLLLLLGIPVTAVVAANVIIGASALLVHANVRWNFGRLQNLLVSPLFHQWHHACVDDKSRDHIGNYGAVLSIWDRMFGTWSLPALKRPSRFGVEDGPRATLLDLVVHPLRVCWRLISQPSAPEPAYNPLPHDDRSGISR